MTATGLSAALLIPIAALAQQAPESNSLPSVVVTATRAAGVEQDLGPNPSATITAEGLAVLGGPGQSNSFTAVQMLPGVIANAVDPYGLSFTRALNVRGKSDFFLDRTINGLPVVGIVGGADILDLRNVASETVYAGPLLANQGFGVSNATGVLDQTVLGPQSQLSLLASQDFGANSFRRTFGRLDSGELASGTALFLSGSSTQANKWKGAGDASRENFMLGVSQKWADQLSASLSYVYNDQKAYNYRPLTYAQTQNLAQYYYLDYYTDFATAPANARNMYYAFNRQQFIDQAVFAEITWKLSTDGLLSFRPYYWKDQGVQNLTPGQNIRYWPQAKDNAGGVLQYETLISSNLRLAVGDWYQSMSPDPPPVSQQNFSVTPQATLQFAGWATLGRFSRHEFDTPFIQLTQTLQSTTVTGGLRYLIESSPRMTYFLTKGLPGASYDDVLQLNPAPDPNGQAPVRHFYALLPNLGVHQQINSELNMDISYSRKVARVDYGPQASSFFGAENAFVSQGLTLQSLMGLLKPELDSDVDLALDWHVGNWSFTPDLYGYKAQNKEVLVADPRTGQSFYQSNASTTGYGLNLSAGYTLSDALAVFVGGTASKETYDQNILIAGTGAPTIFPIKGKQVPNDPKVSLKAALTYKIDGLTLAPAVRYLGSRYGLADNSQSVPAFAIADLTASYDLTRWLHVKEATISLSALNLFDRHYIDLISVNEDNLSSTNYYAGAPRTLSGSFAIRF